MGIHERNSMDGSPPRSRWRFRLGLLDLLGMMTLACLAVATVMALPPYPREDRVYLALVCCGVVIGVLISRGFGGRGIVLGALGASLGGSVAMGVFRTAWWTADESQSVLAWTYARAPYSAIAMSMLQAGLVGLYATAIYAFVSWLIRHGLQGASAAIRKHPVLIPLGAFLPWAPFVVVIGILGFERVGKVPRAVASFDAAMAQDLIVSHTGTCWSVNTKGDAFIEECQHAFFDLQGSQLVQTERVVGSVAGKINFAPSADVVAYATPYGHVFLDEWSSGKSIYVIDVNETGGAVRQLFWSSEGQLCIVGKNEKKLTLSMFRFENKKAICEDTMAINEADDVGNASLLGKWLLLIDKEQLKMWNTKSRRTIYSTKSQGCGFADPFSTFDISDDGKYWSNAGELGENDHSDAKCRMGITSFGFTPASMAVFSIVPHDWLRSLFRDHNSIPFANRLIGLIDYEQVVIVDPATRSTIAKFAATPGHIVDVAISINGKVLGALVQNYGKDKEKTRLYVWDMPENCR